MPNALVTGAPERVPDIAIALRSAGIDILTVLLVTEDVDAAGVLAGIAASAEHRPTEPKPWRRYADMDTDLEFADWRQSVLCMASLQ